MTVATMSTLSELRAEYKALTGETDYRLKEATLAKRITAIKSQRFAEALHREEAAKLAQEQKLARTIC